METCFGNYISSEGMGGRWLVGVCGFGGCVVAVGGFLGVGGEERRCLLILWYISDKNVAGTDTGFLDAVGEPGRRWMSQLVLLDKALGELKGKGIQYLTFC